jgi:hypothetical protein
MRIRDAETGRYISVEEANAMTPDTWVVEEDKPTTRVTSGDNPLLEEILQELKDKADVLALVPYVNLQVVKEVFAKHGVEYEK